MITHDKIRENYIINIFEEDSFYTEKDKQNMRMARKKWMNVASNGKKNILFHGWLDIPTHIGIYNHIKLFLNNPNYNLVAINGNNEEVVEYKDIICENTPSGLGSVTTLIKKIDLTFEYGFDFPNIKKELLEDCIAGLIEEYRCSRREALGIANLLYLYFDNVLNFYNPDLVCIWGYYLPSGRLIRSMCKERGIPVVATEWTVLPGMISFEYLGHMGGSWVSQHSDFFNSLEIATNDISMAKDYLHMAADNKFSRNVHNPVPADLSAKIKLLQEEGKKIILYIETNSAYSGNIGADSTERKTHSPFFGNDTDAYLALSSLCKNKHPDWHIIYKAHPIAQGKGVVTPIDYENTTLVTEANLYDLCDLADCSITLLSQGSYISCIKGLPAVVMGKIQINSSGAVYALESSKDLETQIKKALSNGFSPEKKELFIEHVARILKYYAYSVFPEIGHAKGIEDYSKDLLSVIKGTEPVHLKYERQSVENLTTKKQPTLDLKPIVSVILPVYNAEENLTTCISHILNQTIPDLELICVNNGSTDNSQKIIDYFAQLDPRVRLFYQDEPNQRAARNLGIQEAKGKYIYFSDDDYLDYDAFEKVLATAEEKDSDLIYFFYREVKKNSRGKPRFTFFKRFLPNEKVFSIERNFYKYFIQYPFPWAKIMRRDFALDNKIFFDDKCINFDDNPHNMRALLAAKNPYVHNEVLYNFRIHEKSMTQSTNPRIIGMLDAVDIMNNLLCENKCYTEFQAPFVAYKVHLLGFAWGLLDPQHKNKFLSKVPDLFLPGDEEYFIQDSVVSALGMPSMQNLHIVKQILKYGGDEEYFIQDSVVSALGMPSMQNLHIVKQIPKYGKVKRRLLDTPRRLGPWARKVGQSVRAKSEFAYKIGRAGYRCAREVRNIFY